VQAPNRAQIRFTSLSNFNDDTLVDPNGSDGKRCFNKILNKGYVPRIYPQFDFAD
jgi:hypothetical protein